jgi:hypothetical protein
VSNGSRLVLRCRGMPFSRRNLFIASGALALGGVLWYRSRDAWSRGPKLRDGHPILRMPIAAGMAVLCQQGNLAPAGRTHATTNCLHALDLSNWAETVVEIVAAAPGRVRFVYADSTYGDSSSGLRFGNQVKIEHGGGYFTFYSHLDKIFVREGEELRSGDPIGTMGYTGAAGNRHLHFSLHYGEPVEMGVASTIPMRALVAADLSRGFAFQSIPSVDFIGGVEYLWGGRIYGSENVPTDEPLDREAKGTLRERLGTAHERLRRAVDDRIVLDEVARAWQLYDVVWARKLLDPILETTPRHALAKYWFATAVHMVEKQWAAAEEVFDHLLAHGMNEPTWEMWLRAWIHNRLGIVAIERKRPNIAREHFNKALGFASADPEYRFAREQLERLGAHD